MIFLSARFTEKDPFKQQERVDEYMIADLLLMEAGHHTVGSLHKVFNNRYAGNEELDLSWEYWKEYTIDLIKRCDEIYVLCSDGWETSTGVQDEIKLAKEFGIEVNYFKIVWDGERYQLEIIPKVEEIQ